jgi:hypothetical protein
MTVHTQILFFEQTHISQFIKGEQFQDIKVLQFEYMLSAGRRQLSTVQEGSTSHSLNSIAQEPYR